MLSYYLNFEKKNRQNCLDTSNGKRFRSPSPIMASDASTLSSVLSPSLHELPRTPHLATSLVVQKNRRIKIPIKFF